MTIQLADRTAEGIAELVSNGTFLKASDAVETAVRYFDVAGYRDYGDEELREIEEAVGLAQSASAEPEKRVERG